jgi:hypothetical protein
MKETAVEITDERVRGQAWSQIIRPQESVALYKSFYTFCTEVSNCPFHPPPLHNPLPETLSKRKIWKNLKRNGSERFNADQAKNNRKMDRGVFA